MTIKQWMKENPELVYEVLGDLSVTALANRIDDDMDLGKYIREQLEETYKDQMEATYLPREPDTERMREARAINRGRY